MRQLCLWLIHGGRFMIAPMFGHLCRFEQTCSQDALDVMSRYGAWQGLGLSMVRILKCHPFHPGGEDPVK